jgi:hypothetical protein
VRSEITPRFKEECQENLDTLRCKLLAMDKKLKFCKSFAAIFEVVNEYVQNVSEGSLSLADIPFSDNTLKVS